MDEGEKTQKKVRSGEKRSKVNWGEMREMEVREVVGGERRRMEVEECERT